MVLTVVKLEHVIMHFDMEDTLLSLVHLRGLPRRVSAYNISKSTGFHVDFGFQTGFRLNSVSGPKWPTTFCQMLQ